MSWNFVARAPHAIVVHNKSLVLGNAAPSGHSSCTGITSGLAAAAPKCCVKPSALALSIVIAILELSLLFTAAEVCNINLEVDNLVGANNPYDVGG